MDLAKQAIQALRNARFPVYVVPPSEWHGDIMLRGVWGDKKHALSITISYDDDLAIERSERQIEVVSTGPEGMTQRAPAHAFLLHEGSYEVEIANFVNNIAQRPLPEDRYGTTLPGDRRPLPTVPFRDGLFLERMAFERHPELLLYRTQIPQVEVLVKAWNWDEESITEFARKARPIQDDEELFQQIEDADVPGSAFGPSRPLAIPSSSAIAVSGHWTFTAFRKLSLVGIPGRLGGTAESRLGTLLSRGSQSHGWSR